MSGVDSRPQRHLIRENSSGFLTELTDQLAHESGNVTYYMGARVRIYFIRQGYYVLWLSVCAQTQTCLGFKATLVMWWHNMSPHLDEFVLWDTLRFLNTYTPPSPPLTTSLLKRDVYSCACNTGKCYMRTAKLMCMDMIYVHVHTLYHVGWLESEICSSHSMPLLSHINIHHLVWGAWNAM